MTAPALLSDAAELLDALADPEACADHDKTTLAAIVAALARLSPLIGPARRACEAELAARMDEPVEVIDGVTYERSSRSSRTGWDRQALESAVRRWCRWDPETGEQRNVEEIFERVAEAMQVATGRTKVLREAVGLDLDEYCRTERYDAVRVIS